MRWRRILNHILLSVLTLLFCTFDLKVSADPYPNRSYGIALTTVPASAVYSTQQVVDANVVDFAGCGFVAHTTWAGAYTDNFSESWVVEVGINKGWNCAVGRPNGGTTTNWYCGSVLPGYSFGYAFPFPNQLPVMGAYYNYSLIWDGNQHVWHMWIGGIDSCYTTIPGFPSVSGKLQVGIEMTHGNSTSPVSNVGNLQYATLSEWYWHPWYNAAPPYKTIALGNDGHATFNWSSPGVYTSGWDQGLG